MRRAAALAALLLGGCGRPERTQPAAPESAGARLERAAVAAGLVADPAGRPVVGAWSGDGDRACIVPAGGGGSRIGLLVDDGRGEGCAASGTLVRRGGDRLDLAFGDCRVTAVFDGGRIVLPATVPAACDRLCTGRATLAAMAVGRQSGSVAEAQGLRPPGGRALCGG